MRIGRLPLEMKVSPFSVPQNPIFNNTGTSTGAYTSDNEHINEPDRQLIHIVQRLQNPQINLLQIAQPDAILQKNSRDSASVFFVAIYAFDLRYSLKTVKSDNRY